MAEISVQRALTELKIIDERIKAALNKPSFVFIAQGRGDKKKVLNYTNTVEEIENSIKSAHQSINDLIARRMKLKNAVMASNATTKVKIGDEVYTVQQAIDQKQIMVYKQSLVEAMNQSIALAVQTMGNLQKQLEEKIERSINAVYGSERSKITEEQLSMISNSHRDESEPNYIDPLKISTTRDKLVEEINTFMSEVDCTLSEVNARTMIQID